MRPVYGDDYAIACCVSAMRIGKDMQFFGARANLAKLVLLAINGGRDELKGDQVGPKMPVWPEEYLDYDQLMERIDFYRPWLAKTYVNAMNIIHYMHDKYSYEKSQMALHDTTVRRLMAFGIAGMSCHGRLPLRDQVRQGASAIRDPETGLVTDFETEGDFPKFGNDDDRVDQIACEQAEQVLPCPVPVPSLYRQARAHLVHPHHHLQRDVRQKDRQHPRREKARASPWPLAPTPCHGRDTSGALASLNSVAKLSYDYCRDGISNTFSITPQALGKTETQRIDNLVSILDRLLRPERPPPERERPEPGDSHRRL